MRGDGINPLSARSLKIIELETSLKQLNKRVTELEDITKTLQRIRKKTRKKTKTTRRWVLIIYFVVCLGFIWYIYIPSMNS